MKIKGKNQRKSTYSPAFIHTSKLNNAELNNLQYLFGVKVKTIYSYIKQIYVFVFFFILI